MTQREDFHKTYRKRLRGLIATFAVDWLVPLPVYFALLSYTNVIAALAAASAIPVVHTTALFVWRRQVNWLGILAIVGFAGGLTTALLGGGVLSLKIYGSVITAALGAVFLISAAVKRPFLVAIVNSLNIGDPQRFEKPLVRRRATVITIGFGVAFLYDAITHVVLALTLPTDTYVVADRVITLSTIILLVLVVRLVMLRMRLASSDPGQLGRTDVIGGDSSEKR